MTLQFVNLRGEPIAVTSGKAASKSKGSSADSFHKGWHVVGFSPEQLAEARRSHPVGGKPFDPASYMRTSKPRKVQAKPFVIHDSAEQCAEMARRAGWQLVQVVAKAKGGNE